VIYENVVNFWRQQNAPDAIKLSMAGTAAAVQLASAARAGSEAEAADRSHPGGSPGMFDAFDRRRITNSDATSSNGGRR